MEEMVKAVHEIMQKHDIEVTHKTTVEGLLLYIFYDDEWCSETILGRIETPRLFEAMGRTVARKVRSMVAIPYVE